MVFLVLKRTAIDGHATYRNCHNVTIPNSQEPQRLRRIPTLNRACLRLFAGKQGDLQVAEAIYRANLTVEMDPRARDRGNGRNESAGEESEFEGFSNDPITDVENEAILISNEETDDEADDDIPSEQPAVAPLSNPPENHKLFTPCYESLKDI